MTITVRKTTTVVNGKKKVTRRMTEPLGDLRRTTRPVGDDQRAGGARSCGSEALQAQSANIQLVSGATDVSRAFVQSLQSAIMAALKA